MFSTFKTSKEVWKDWLIYWPKFKALGEYLERERASFPRFYFVGDEDLLEIIGNSKNIARLQKHFKKMFAGITAILLNEDSTIIKGIASKEGEEVMFVTPVSTAENP